MGTQRDASGTARAEEGSHQGFAGVSRLIDAFLRRGAVVPSRNQDRVSAADIAAPARHSQGFIGAFHRVSMLASRVRRAFARRQRAEQLEHDVGLSCIDQLHEAARHGRLAAVRSLLADGLEPDARISDEADTALVLAVRRGHVPVVRALLEAGADPNRRDLDGLTPLMRAVIDGSDAESTVRQLVALGADLYAEHLSGLTAVDLAKEDSAKADLACVLDSLAEKADDAPSVFGIAEPARVRPVETREIETLRGLGNQHVSEVVIAVCAPIDEVAPALERARGGRQWSRKIFDDQGFFPGEEGYLVYQFRGHDWTLAQTALLDRRSLHATDARILSKQLGCDAALIEICEPAEVLRYALYREGRQVEEFRLLPNQKTVFDSVLRDVAATERETPLEFVDRSLAEWGLFVPGLGDDRLEVLARDFRPADFERVDFLRVDGY